MCAMKTHNVEMKMNIGKEREEKSLLEFSYTFSIFLSSHFLSFSSLFFSGQVVVAFSRLFHILDTVKNKSTLLLSTRRALIVKRLNFLLSLIEKNLRTLLEFQLFFLIRWEDRRHRHRSASAKFARKRQSLGAQAVFKVFTAPKSIK